MTCQARRRACARPGPGATRLLLVASLSASCAGAAGDELYGPEGEAPSTCCEPCEGDACAVEADWNEADPDEADWNETVWRAANAPSEAPPLAELRSPRNVPERTADALNRVRRERLELPLPGGGWSAMKGACEMVPAPLSQPPLETVDIVPDRRRRELDLSAICP